MNKEIESIAEKRIALILRKVDTGLTEDEQLQLDSLNLRLSELVPRVTDEDFKRLESIKQKYTE